MGLQRARDLRAAEEIGGPDRPVGERGDGDGEARPQDGRRMAADREQLLPERAGRVDERAHGTLWQKLLAVGRHSATILWARFTVAVAALADGAVWVADFLGSPQVAGAMQAHLDPRTVAAVMVAVAVVSELARRRTLSKG